MSSLNNKSTLFSGIEEEQHKRHFWSAKLALGAVAFICLGYGIIYGLTEDRWRNEYTVAIVIGVIFAVLFFIVKRAPFQATLAGLILYGGGEAINFFSDPRSLTKGIVLKIIIIAALVNGVRSGWLLKKQGKKPADLD